MLSSVKPSHRPLLAGITSVAVAGVFAIASQFSEITIAYNGILVLMLMLLVVGIGQHRQARRGVETRRLPLYWPVLLALTVIFLSGPDSLATFRVLTISFL